MNVASAADMVFNVEDRISLSAMVLHPSFSQTTDDGQAYDSIWSSKN
jgi:hypothetical protein